MPTIQERIGQRIRRLREGRGWKQESLAEKSGLHPTYIGGIERGERNATIESYLKIANSFGIPVDELFKLDVHDLEKKFNAPGYDILDAILAGFRAQVDVKGRLAELYLSRELDRFKVEGLIQDYFWSDKDGEPDFNIKYLGNEYIIECKNLRSGEEGKYKKDPAYKVEVQKTRNSKDGSPTRSYPVDHFDILAVCMFNQTGKWNFIYSSAKNLERTSDEKFLKTFHPVPFMPSFPWTTDFSKIIKDVAGEVKFEPEQ